MVLWLCEDVESRVDRLPVLDVMRVMSSGATPGEPSYIDRVLSDVTMQKDNVHRALRNIF